jgi:hypothetical protein
MATPTVDDIRSKASALAYGKPLIENSYRGLIAEIIIGEALSDWQQCSGDWRGWDFEHATGYRLEVKQSAARQTWAAPKNPSPASFDIRERSGYYKGATWISQAGRLAHIYVFAYHPIRDDSADHRDPSQWQFYIVPTTRLPATKRIGLAKVALLAPAVSWPQLAAAVERTRGAIYIENRSGKP